MRSRIFFLAILMASCVSGFSQVSFGIQGGGVFSTPKVKQNLFDEVLNAESRVSWQAGFIADVPLGEGNFRFMPELNYSNKGYSVKTETTALGLPTVLSGNSNIGYVELPVNLVYAFDLGGPRLVLGAGPYIGYAVNGKSKFEASVGGTIVNTLDQDIKFGSGVDETNPLDYGGNLFAGLLINSGLMLKVNYSMGMAELSNRDNTSYKNNGFGATLAYFFKK